jgi:TonB family protein
MKNLRFILMFCLLGWGSSFAQNSAAVVSASNCDAPEYPSDSKRLEEEGTVRLKLLVGVDGKVLESVVEKSSGFKRLDEAARLSLSKCQFKPATIEGRAQQSWATMTYTFSLGPSRPCNGEDVSKWDRCLGSQISPLGGMTVIEYVRGKQNGAGIEYDKSGNVIRSGIFNDGNLVAKRTLDTSKYPFKKQITESNQTNPTTNIRTCSGSDISNWNNCFASTVDLSGATYVGEWKAGRWDGKGTHTLLNGDRYVGEFKAGNYNGFGTYFFSDGEKYIGEFKNDLRNGKGTYFYLNGNQYIGQWKDDFRSGLGTQYYASGSKYVGEFKNHKLNGLGTLFANNGEILKEGNWLDDKFVRNVKVLTAGELKELPVCPGIDVAIWNNCVGVSTSSNGSIYQGEFKRGKLDGDGSTLLSNGNYHVGKYIQGKRSGFGTLTFANGDKYFGEFNNDRRAGEGFIKYSDGRAGVGEWKNSKPHGKFIEFKSDTNIEFSGIYEDGKLIKSEYLDIARFNRINQKLLNEQVFYSNLVIAQKQTRIALVIGNAKYKIKPLNNSKNDADDVSLALKETGFEVIDLRDATLTEMRSAVRQFGDRLIKNDVGLVYYSGHGVEVKGRNYFIPVNADIQREDEIADQGLDVSLILEKMSTAGKGVNILIVDACRDDPFGRSFRSTSRGLAQMDAPRGTIIAYATSPGKVASDGDPRERNSPYTKYLVRAMQSPNKPIEQVFKEVRRAVQDETKNQQTPWENTSLSGDFFFKVLR